MKEKKLTKKQREFCFWYVKHGVGVRAAEQAGYKGSYDVLCSVSKENLRKPPIIAEVARLQAKREAQLAGIGLNDVIEEHQRIAKKAEEAGQLSVAQKAYDYIARLQGLYEKDNKQKSEVTVKYYAPEKRDDV